MLAEDQEPGRKEFYSSQTQLDYVPLVLILIAFSKQSLLIMLASHLPMQSCEPRYILHNARSFRL
jgi:hypothetical protein